MKSAIKKRKTMKTASRLKIGQKVLRRGHGRKTINYFTPQSSLGIVQYFNFNYT